MRIPFIGYTDFQNLSPLIVVGCHPAALPQNHGRHPIIRALGLEQAAPTFFLTDEGADSGDILSQVCVAIELTAQARLRGSQSGYRAAEAFMLLRERND